MKIILYLTGFFLLYSCSQKTSLTNAKNNELKVLTYNIHHANPPSKKEVIDIDAIVNVIHKESPDVIALQELDKYTMRSGQIDQAAIIAKKTGMYYHFFKAINYQGGEYGIAILSKLPIKNPKQILLPKVNEKAETRTLGYVELQHPNGQRIIFACTHLCVESEESRLLQVKAILDELSLIKIPIVLCGDLNAVQGSRSINLLQQQFTNSCTNNCGFTVPADIPRRNIDFILTKNTNWVVKNYYVVDEDYASDHRPVTAIFSLTP